MRGRMYRNALIARVEDLKYAEARAIIDGRELIEPPLTTWDPFEKLHVHLEAVSRLRLLVPLPPFAMGSMFLIGRQPVQLVPMQNPMDGGPRNGELVKALQVVGDFARPEVVLLPQIQDLADDVWRCGPRAPVGDARTVAQRGVAAVGVPLFPLIESLAGNAEMPAGVGHVPVLGCRVLQEP